MSKGSQTEDRKSFTSVNEASDSCKHEWECILAYYKVMTIPDCYGITGRQIRWELWQCAKCLYASNRPADIQSFYDLYGE